MIHLATDQEHFPGTTGTTLARKYYRCLRYFDAKCNGLRMTKNSTKVR
jgi:hypothetical protein